MGHWTPTGDHGAIDKYRPMDHIKYHCICVTVFVFKVKKAALEVHD